MGWGGTRREDHDLAPDLLLDAVAADLQLMVRGEAGVAAQQPDAVALQLVLHDRELAVEDEVESEGEVSDRDAAL